MINNLVIRIITAESFVGRNIFFKIIAGLIQYSYVLIVNLPYWGRPSKDTLQFIVSGYKEAFLVDIPLGYRFFYSLYGKDLIHILTVNGSPSGFALFRSGPRGNIHIVSLATLQAARGKGLAKPFLAASLKYWESRKFTSASVTVSSANKIALKIYESLEFKTIMNFGPHFCMSKSLSG